MARSMSSCAKKGGGNDETVQEPRGSTGNTAPNEMKENDTTLLLEMVDQFQKRLREA